MLNLILGEQSVEIQDWDKHLSHRKDTGWIRDKIGQNIPFDNHNLLFTLYRKGRVEESAGFVRLHLLDHLGDEGSSLGDTREDQRTIFWDILVKYWLKSTYLFEFLRLGSNDGGDVDFGHDGVGLVGDQLRKC